MSDNTILLDRFQFCHVQDKNTAVISLSEGPLRLQLESHQQLVQIFKKIRILDGQFAIVRNPFNAGSGDIAEGERELRIGPLTFALHPGESLENGVQDEFVLTDSDALLLRAEKDVPHPCSADKILLSGNEFLLKGPCRFIPHKDICVKEQRVSISLAEGQGVHVQNDDSGDVRLIKGPCDFFLEHNESFWDKHLTHEELQALGFVAQNATDGSRVLSAVPRKRNADHDAVVIDLEDKEAICLFDDIKTRVEFGPQTVFLNPNERPKVLLISGGVPVRPNVLRIAKLGLGPDFIRDELVVRTKDNASLKLEITFRWRFIIDEKTPEKLFALKDFVGFAAQTLSSEIREEAAQHTFERFHSEASALVKRALFGSNASRIFEENGLEIFGIDVEGIHPEDNEIKQKLAQAIKANVDIFTRRVQEEAQLESERRLIDGRAKNQEASRELIELELGNQRKRSVEAAKIESDAELERARGSVEAERLHATASREAEEAKLAAIAAVLNGPGGKALIELERARAFKETDKVVVPTDSKLVLGISNSILDD